MNAYKTPTLRSRPVTSRRALTVLTSADGTRRALKTLRKLRFANGSYIVVESWRLRQRVNGKWVTFAPDASADDAHAFLA